MTYNKYLFHQCGLDEFIADGLEIQNWSLDEVDGKGYSTSFVTGFMIFDNNNEDKLEASKGFLNFLYSNDSYLDYEREGLPANKSVAERSGDLIFNLDEYFNNSSTTVNFTANNPNWQGSETSVRNIFYLHIHDLLTDDKTPKECAKSLDRDCNAAIKAGRNSSLHK